MTAAELLSIEFPDATAAELVRQGECTGACMIALEQSCDCRCGGMFHGALASEVVKPNMPRRVYQEITVLADREIARGYIAGSWLDENGRVESEVVLPEQGIYFHITSPSPQEVTPHPLNTPPTYRVVVDSQ